MMTLRLFCHNVVRNSSRKTKLKTTFYVSRSHFFAYRIKDGREFVAYLRYMMTNLSSKVSYICLFIVPCSLFVAHMCTHVYVATCILYVCQKECATLTHFSSVSKLNRRFLAFRQSVKQSIQCSKSFSFLVDVCQKKDQFCYFFQQCRHISVSLTLDADF